MRRPFRWISIAVFGVVAVASVCFAPYLNRTLAAEAEKSSQNPPSKNSGAAPQGVEVVKPKRENVARTLDVPATVEAVEQADLYAKTSGYLTEVKVDIGDRVKAGQILALIDVPEMTKDLEEAKARQRVKDAMLSVASGANLKSADAAVTQYQKKLEMSRQQMERNKVELTLKDMTFQRKQRLFNDKAITDQDFDEVRSQLDVARAELKVAESRVAAADADVISAQAARTAAEAQITVAKAELDLANAQTEKAAALLNYAQIVAPFDGVVTKRTVDRGSLVQAATTSRTMPLFTLQRIDTVRVFIEVPESDLAHIKPGSAAKVKPYAMPGDALDGKVVRIASALNPGTRTMRAEIDLPNPDSKLLHGMYVQVSMNIDEHANAMTIPAATLLTEGRDAFVYVVQDGQAVRKPVKTGIDDGIRIEIKDGLRDDDLIVRNGKGLIAPGSRVRAVLQNGG